jgi:hypothetical protein
MGDGGMGSNIKLPARFCDFENHTLPVSYLGVTKISPFAPNITLYCARGSWEIAA